MRRFSKENIALMIGISLPFLVLIIFLLATTLPKLWVEDPKYNFLYVTYNYNTQNLPYLVQFDLNQGKLDISATSQNPQDNWQVAELFLFDVKTQTSRAIKIPEPTFKQPIDDKTPQKVALSIPEIQALTLNGSVTAPDGYNILLANNKIGSIFSVLFFSNTDYNTIFILKKNGNVIQVPVPTIDKNNYSRNAKFLGWVISE